MKLIDEAKTRTARQQVVPESVITSLQHDRLIPSSQARREVLLDVVGNVPLKVYDVNHRNLDEIVTSSWVPSLHLSEEELRVVEEPGTVLLLGRSGTGKVKTAGRFIDSKAHMLIFTFSPNEDCVYLQ